MPGVGRVALNTVHPSAASPTHWGQCVPPATIRRRYLAATRVAFHSILTGGSSFFGPGFSIVPVMVSPSNLPEYLKTTLASGVPRVTVNATTPSLNVASPMAAGPWRPVTMPVRAPSVSTKLAVIFAGPVLVTDVHFQLPETSAANAVTVKRETAKNAARRVRGVFMGDNCDGGR